MNLIAIGKFLSQKRKEQNMTQEQLAKKLHVSNKTISKWETGKSMPDYQTINPLCHELKITIHELLEGKADEGSHSYNNESQVMDLLTRIQTLENQKNLLLGLMLTITGILFFVMSNFIHGSAVRDFISGVLVGIAVGESLIGVYIMAQNIYKNLS